MNQVAAQRAIKKLIKDYASVLVSGIEHQGQAREIEDIVLSPMTAPRAYYHILVQVQRVDSSSADPIGNQARPKRLAEYEIVIHVVDAAVPSGGAGAEPYVLMHTDFRNLCDGIAALVAGSYWPGGGTYNTYFQSLPLCIRDPDSGSKFILKRGGRDRAIRISNLDQTWNDPDTNQWTPIFYSVIEFALQERVG